MSLSIIILAAGKGTRMKSTRPKVIHELAGKPMLQHVVDASKSLNPEQILVVVGHESDQVEQALLQPDLDFVLQREQLGTGHAVMQCNDSLIQGNDILVLYGDVPLIRTTTLADLVAKGRGEVAVSLLSFNAEDSTGYGRIVRDQAGQVKSIVEEKDASDDTRAIRECNSGIVLIKGSEYKELLEDLDNDNAQQEYYLTDVVKHAVSRDHDVEAIICKEESEVMGVNDQLQLAEVEKIYRKRQVEDLMQQGVKIVDPERIDVRGTMNVGRDVTIDVNCVFEGDVELDDNVRVDANCVVINSSIGAGTHVLPMCMIEDARIGESNSIGPFARIRPETRTLAKAKIGNFVEVKKSVIGEGSKVNHLTYIGDTEMGRDVNIGAGTITCNYDGAFKHTTIIEDEVFVGSDTQLVAPVRVARGTTIGAGSTITKDTQEGELALSRAKQTSLKGWSRPKKN